jgi:competence protein ComEA
MFKKFLAFFLAMALSAAFAAVDVNNATAVQLDGIKGIGPVMSGKILTERKQGNFKSWTDFITRVQGIGPVNAEKFSNQGLTVGGSAFKLDAPASKDKAATTANPIAAPAPAPAVKAKTETKTEVKTDVKADVKATAKVDAAKPAASAAKK